MPPAQVGATRPRDTSAVLYARLSGGPGSSYPKATAARSTHVGRSRRTRAGAPRLPLPGCARNAQRGRDSLPQTAGLRLSPEDARRLNEGETLSLRQLGCALAPWTHVDFTCQEAYNETERRLDPSHGTSPPSILSSVFAFGRPSPHSPAQLSTLTGRQPIVMPPPARRDDSLRRLTLGHHHRTTSTSWVALAVAR